MRTLLVSPKMPLAFWSMESSCRFKAAKALTPPLGLLTVAALLPEDWELRLVDMHLRSLSEADWQWAELVLVGGMLIQAAGYLEVVREAKKRGKTVVAGGPYSTLWSREVLEAGADIVVQGEAEGQIPAILEAIEARATGVILTPAERPEMGLSPVPRYDLLNFDDYVVMNIQTSRGCPYNCEFCDVIKLFGRKPRYKSPQQVLAELERLYDLGYRGQVFVADDNFIGNKGHARAILDRLIPWMKEHDEPFYYWTQTSVNLGEDLELIDLLTTANFSTVFIGVESTEAEVLTKSGKHHNKAGELRTWIHNLNANGLETVASFILGFDGEKPGADARICQIIEDCHLPWVMVNILAALPGTDLWERLRREGRLKPLSDAPTVADFVLNFTPSRPEAEIVAEWRNIIMQVYEPGNYLRRAYDYILTMRPTRSHLASQSKQPLSQPTGQRKSKPEFNLKKAYIDLRGAAILFWRQGIKASYRGQFWRQLWGIWQRNPSRLRKYLVLCALGENGFALRRQVQNGFTGATPGV